MPVFHSGGDVDDGAGKYFHRRFTFFLIPSATCNAHEHLSAAILSFVDVPVVAATRLKSDVKERYLFGGYGCKVAVAGEILGICRVGFAYGEYHRAGEGGFCIFVFDVVVPHFFGEVERSPCLGPSGIEGYVGYDFGNFSAGYAVLLRSRKVIFERIVGYAHRDERCYCHKAAVTQRKKVVSAPNLAEKYVIVEVGELRGEVA